MTKLESQLVEAGYKIKYRSLNELTVQYCCFHSDSSQRTPSMTINTEKRMFRCMSCGEHGSIYKLLRKCGIECNYEPVQLSELELLMADAETETLTRSSKEEYKADPKEYKEYAKLFHPYLISRGFSKSFIIANKIGFDKVTSRVTIPQFDEHKHYMGCAKRSIFPDDLVKISYPKNMPKDSFVYKPKMFPEEWGVLLVVEGPLDALKACQYGFAAVAIQGTYMSAAQYKSIGALLEKQGAKNRQEGKAEPQAILSLDNDLPGKNATLTILEKFGMLDYKVFTYPFGAKDIGELGKEQIQNGIDASISVLEII